MDRVAPTGLINYNQQFPHNSYSIGFSKEKSNLPFNKLEELKLILENIDAELPQYSSPPPQQAKELHQGKAFKHHLDKLQSLISELDEQKQQFLQSRKQMAMDVQRIQDSFSKKTKEWQVAYQKKNECYEKLDKEDQKQLYFSGSINIALLEEKLTLLQKKYSFCQNLFLILDELDQCQIGERKAALLSAKEMEKKNLNLGHSEEIFTKRSEITNLKLRIEKCRSYGEAASRQATVGLRAPVMSFFEQEVLKQDKSLESKIQEATNLIDKASKLIEFFHAQS